MSVKWLGRISWLVALITVLLPLPYLVHILLGMPFGYAIVTLALEEHHPLRLWAGGAGATGAIIAFVAGHHLIFWIAHVGLMVVAIILMEAALLHHDVAVR